MLFDKIRCTGCASGEYSTNNITLYDTDSIILYLLYFQEEVIVGVVFVLIGITKWYFVLLVKRFLSSLLLLFLYFFTSPLYIQQTHV